VNSKTSVILIIQRCQMINYFVFGITYAFVCVLQPGPFQAFLITQSLTNGWRKTIPLVFAPLISDLPVIILVLLVLTNVPEEVLRILQCIGGVFLLYLALNAYKAWRTFNERVKQDVSSQRDFFKAVIVNLLNPGPYLGWSLVMGPLLIKGWSEKPGNGILLLIGFYSSMIIYSIVMVVLFGIAGNIGPQVNRISIGISVIALVIFGVYQFWSGII
jgi:threonine/homoserine/homoserine lactone efflux protein